MAFWVHFACRELLKHLNFREEGDTSEWFKHELWNAMFGKPSSKHTVEGRTLSNPSPKKGVSKYQWVALEICTSSSVFLTGCYLRIHGIFSTAMFTRETFLQFVTIMHVFWLEGGCNNPSRPGEATVWFFLMPELLGKKPEFFCISDKKNKHLKFLIFGWAISESAHFRSAIGKDPKWGWWFGRGHGFIRPKGFCFGMTSCQELSNISSLVQESPKVVDDWDVGDHVPMTTSENKQFCSWPMSSRRHFHLRMVNFLPIFSEKG